MGNLVAIIGVAIGMVALAVGAGPRTASNDLYHRIMLALATASLVILLIPHGVEAELNRRLIWSDWHGQCNTQFRLQHPGVSAQMLFLSSMHRATVRARHRPRDASRLVSRQAQRDKFCRQIGTPGRNDDKLLAVQHVGHRRSRRVTGQGYFSNNLPGRLVVGAEFGVVDLEVRHHLGAALAMRAALLADDEQGLRQEQVTTRRPPEGPEAKLS
jgi:hypothetical protein